MAFDVSFSSAENASLFSWSPDGVFLARAVNTAFVIEELKEDRLAIKNATLPSRIDHIEWSADSSYVACGVYPLGIIQVFSVDQPIWNCKINLGNEEDGVGLEDFSWGPDARSILTTAAYYVQLTVWSISGDDVSHIRDILPIKKNKSFSANGKFMAIAQFDDNYATCLSIFTTGNWKKKISFPVICQDLEEVSWCPHDLVILLRESSLFCGIYLYTQSGELVKHFSPDGLAVGMSLSLWAPTGQFLVSFNHRNFLRILNGLSYGLLLEEKVEPTLPKSYPQCQRFLEKIHETFGVTPQSAYKREIDLFTLPLPTCLTTSLKQTTLMKFSWDSKFLAVTSDSYPTTVWIWDMAKVTLAAVLVHINDVSDFDWHPFDTKLSIATNQDQICFWTPKLAEIKRIKLSLHAPPPNSTPRSPPWDRPSHTFKCSTIKWSFSSGFIALNSKDDKLVVATTALSAPKA